MTHFLESLQDGSLPLGAATLDRLAGLVAAVDRTLTQLSSDGLIGPHQPCDGEEATLVGAAAALQAKDWAFWGSQVCVPALLRGLSPETLIADALYATEAAAIAADRIVVCTQGPATRLPHAVGLAWAARKDGVCALVEVGDGSLADGDVHVGLNFAAVMNAPVVFVVRSDGTRPVAERGDGYGMASTRVDGMDASAVFAAVSTALERARQGGGPSLVEARVRRGVALPPGRASEHEETVAVALARAKNRQPRPVSAVEPPRAPVTASSTQSSQRPS
jgi:TPP-dependent pyruvate/acetoin dehydrogenase alpha subunit